MELAQLIIIFIVGAALVWVLRNMFKSLSTVIAIIAIVCFVYLLVSGNANHLTNPDLSVVFRKNNVTQLYNSYCCRGCVKENRPICTCVIEPVFKDMTGIYSPQQLREIEYHTIRGMSPELQRVFDYRKEEMHYCLENSHADKDKIIKQFQRFFYKW